jgi:hypothetical protein
MAPIDDLLSDVRDRAGVAFTAPSRSTDYSYAEFCTDAWKAGNLFTHYGVHEGATVAVVVGPADSDDEASRGRLGETPEPLFAILGAWLLGGVVEVEPTEPIDGAAVVGPAHLLDRCEVAPGCSRLAYGESPSDPATGHFERERWSENPVEPPNDVSADAVALAGPERPTQRALLETARTAVSDGTIRADDRVGIDAPLGAKTLALGVLAPLAGGATIVGGVSAGVDVQVDATGGTRLSE